ncbi:MAG: TetR/AcrR family transcriptional regulator [Solirubrobacterales bacterium]|nr:TetR/AcrR family transcriptional regulator [Solirubrobacterales bacterium]
MTVAAPATMRSTEPRTPYPVAARELLRDTLLDAAGAELYERRWSDITMADIARSAGVSRQTLYNEFGSREEFAQVLVMRESDRFLDAVEHAVRAHLNEPAEALAAAFGIFLTAAAENPLVRTIVGGDGAEQLLALFTTQGKPLVDRATERVTDVLLSGWPLVARQDAELLSECLVRLAISYAALPQGPASMTASSLARLLGPYIERVVKESSA